jgi:antitoxin HigA-1
LPLARYFGFTAEYWLNMQAQYDLEIIRRQSVRQIEKEIKPREAASRKRRASAFQLK